MNTVNIARIFLIIESKNNKVNLLNYSIKIFKILIFS